MSVRNRNILVGVVVIFAVLSLGWMILSFSSMPVGGFFSKGTPFKIVADRADGLSEGSSVLYLGVQVGRVTAVRRVPNKSQVEIDAVLNEGEVLPANVVGFIKSQSQLSSATAVSLEAAGEPSTDAMKEGQVVKAIHRGAGFIPEEFTSLARSANDRQLVLHIDQAVEDMRRLIVSSNELIGNPQLRADLVATMTNMRQSSENLKQFADKLDVLTGETTDTLKQVRTTIAHGDQKLEDLSQQLGGRLTQLGELFDRFNTIASKVEKGEGTLGSLINDQQLYASLVDTSKELSLTIKDLRRLVEQWEQEGLSLKLK